MKLSALKPISLLLASSFASAQLPDPSVYSCPDGLIKSNGTTYGMIGASANAVSSVIGDFFNGTFLGATFISTTGVDNRPGATRTATFDFPGAGILTAEEKLLSYTKLPTGVLKWLFKLANAPLQFAPEHAPGEFYGYWIGLESIPISDNETLISWGSVICSSKQVFDFATTHELGINQTIQILRDEGKITGVNQYPICIGERVG
ncbi:hypothetical protein GGI35DRAFT_470128 [Trichoderma velutinum]